MRETATLRRVIGLLPLLGLVGAAVGLVAWFGARATHWSVMTDELQTSKLATSFAQTLTPTIHGRLYGGPSQLYPLLISPFFAVASAPHAIAAAHVLNAVLFASAAVPVFLLARSVTGSRSAGLVAAALTALSPWLVLSTTLLTENAAFPAFAWLLYLAHRDLAAPGLRGDGVLAVALLVAFLVRPQLSVVAVAIPFVLLAHEAGYTVTVRGGRMSLAGLRVGAAASLRDHRLLWFLYASGAVIVAVLVAVGRLRWLFGNYAGTVGADVFPRGVWLASVRHLDVVVVGSGIAPFLLAAGWTAVALVRPRTREAHAFATLFLVLVPFLAFEAASFDLRFTPGAFVQDRYLCYLVPLFAVGAAAALFTTGRRRAQVCGVIAAGAGFAALAGIASYTTTPIFWAAPGAAFDVALDGAAGRLGLTPGGFVRLTAVVLTLALALAVLRVSRPGARLALGALLAAYLAFETGYVLVRFAGPATRVQSSSALLRRDWIDAAVPSGSSVALVPNPYHDRVYWWDAELWNKTVDRTLRIENGPTFTPFPADPIVIDPRTGNVRTPLRSRFLVLDSSESRFGLVGQTVLASSGALELVHARQPYKAKWTTNGTYPDGWLRPGRDAHIVVYPSGKADRAMLTLVFSDPPAPATDLGVVVGTGGRAQRRGIQSTQPLRLAVALCVPADRPAGLLIRATAGARIPDGRTVGPHLDNVAVRPTGHACA